jgi:membrane-bound metal-dependent hydrolase YbcI (DUF457 family)
MPFTPYHFGPALIIKGIFRTRFCLISFALSQIIIDLESLYHLIFHNWPIHCFLHSYLGASIVIFITIFLAKLILALLQQSVSWRAIIFASIVGSYSHVFLDSIMHSDIRPFYPIFESNALLRIISLPLLHDICIYSGIFGLIIIVWQLIPKIIKNS